MKINVVKFDNPIVFAMLLIVLSASQARAQVAASGNYRLEQSVIAAGGGTSSGGNYSVAGTSGQNFAGAVSGNASYDVMSGFWLPAAFAPTASSVAISGRVLTPTGRCLTNAFVVLIENNGNRRTMRTNAFGRYQFTDIAAGETYVFEVKSKHYVFVPQIVNLIEDMTDINFTAVAN